MSTIIVVFLLPVEMKSFPLAQHKPLQVGSRSQRPAYIPAHLPALPDPHTYIKTPVSSYVNHSCHDSLWLPWIFGCRGYLVAMAIFGCHGYPEVVNVVIVTTANCLKC